MSKASPIEASIADKIAFVELGGGGSVERTYELYFVLIEISTQRHSMFGSSRSCLLFEKNVITNINTNSTMMITWPVSSKQFKVFNFYIII